MAWYTKINTSNRSHASIAIVVASVANTNIRQQSVMKFHKTLLNFTSKVGNSV